MSETHTQTKEKHFFAFEFWFPAEPPVMCCILGKESIILLKFEHQNFDELN